MSVNSVTFVAPNLAGGEARGGSIPRQRGCDRRATKPEAKCGATLRAAVLFGPGCVARSLQIRVGYARVPVRKHLAPCRGRKLLAANVTEFTLLTTLPIRPEVTLDVRVFAFTALASLLTGMVFGFAPAWQGTKVHLASALKDESTATSGRRSRIASLLIAGQVAVCLVLLIASGLCLRSLFNAQNVQLGFQVQNASPQR